MKDEIKEKLDNLRIYAGREENGFICDIEDYITNLQQENEKLKENAEHNDKVVDKARWNEMIYKSRNEKAIKLLKEAGCYDEETKTFCDDVWEELPKLLNILQGEDKDEQTK